MGILGRIFGDPIDQDYWLDRNVFHLAKTKNKTLKDLPIYFDVSENDRYGLHDTCPPWSKLLTEKGIEHTFRQRPRRHGNRFFTENVPFSLEFVGKHFNAALKKAAPKKGK